MTRELKDTGGKKKDLPPPAHLSFLRHSCYSRHMKTYSTFSRALFAVFLGVYASGYADDRDLDALAAYLPVPTTNRHFYVDLPTESLRGLLMQNKSVQEYADITDKISADYRSLKDAYEAAQTRLNEQHRLLLGRTNGEEALAEVEAKLAQNRAYFKTQSEHLLGKNRFAKLQSIVFRAKGRFALMSDPLMEEDYWLDEGLKKEMEEVKEEFDRLVTELNIGFAACQQRENPATLLQFQKTWRLILKNSWLPHATDEKIELSPSEPVYAYVQQQKELLFRRADRQLSQIVAGDRDKKFRDYANYKPAFDFDLWAKQNKLPFDKKLLKR